MGVNMVYDIKRKTQTEPFWNQDAEEDIWTEQE
jgi:hypothetical protein